VRAPPAIHTLANGATLICDPVPGYDTLAVSIVAGRGARYEDEARSGWSHLLEHMVFKGAGERSARAIVEAIESQGGQLNAATGHERTSFQVRALSGGLPLALEVIADLVQRPALDKGDLAREKKVVGQEIAEAADTPDDHVFERAQGVAFADQPLGRSILGSSASLKPASSTDMESWRAMLYAPDRMVVSVAGAVDEGEFLALAEARFGSAAQPSSCIVRQAMFSGGFALETRRLEQAHLVFLLPAPGMLDPDYWALRVFAEMLGGGMSSRLFQEARERLGLAYAIDAYVDAYADVSVLGVYSGCAAKDAGRLAEVAAAEIRALASTASAAELARGKTQLKASLFMSRESLLSRTEQAAAQHLTFGRLISTREMADDIDAVSLDDIARLGPLLLASQRDAVSVLGPKGAQDAAPRFQAALFG